MSIEIKEEGGISQASHALGDAKKIERLLKKIDVENFNLGAVGISIAGDNSREYLSGFEDSLLEFAIVKGLRDTLALYVKAKRQEAHDWLEFALKGEASP